MKTLFEVGEEVILCSKTYPELNGDALVLMVVNSGIAEFNCPHCERNLSGKRLRSSSYYLNVPSKHEVYGCCSPWLESALRKKHKGSNFSFDDIISEINSIEKIEA